MAVPFTLFDSNATIGTTARSLPGDTTSGVPTSQTTAGVLGGFIDFFAVAAGDSYDVKLYEKVDAGTQRLVATWVVDYAQVFTLPNYHVSEGWDVTVAKTAGTDRAVRWALKLRANNVNLEQWLGSAPNALVSGRVDVSVGALASAVITAASIAADALTAAKVADDVSTEFATKLLATQVYGTITVEQLLRGVLDSNAGRTSGFGTGTILIKSQDGTKTRFTVTVDATGRTAVTVGDLT